MDDHPTQAPLPGFEAWTAPNPDGAIFAADLTGDASAPETAANAIPTPTNPQPPTPNPAPEALVAYIALVRAQPDVIPELVGGTTLAEVETSAAQARSAYAGVRERVLRSAQGTVPFAQAGSTIAPPLARGFAAIAAGVRAGG